MNRRELGRAGREFIASGAPASRSARSAVARREPIRVYVGLQGGRTAQERAKLALEELKRQGGFSRSVLIVIMPTGSGWIDPAAMNSVEYLHDGDIASVAIQYSYLNSPLSLLVQPEYGAEAGRALFVEIYRYWTALPKDKRPRFYVHGLSLGALNSARSFDLFDIIGDPIAGAVWSGPPFASGVWRSITDGRNDGSPMWLPEFRDSRIVRFMNQNGSTLPPDTPGGRCASSISNTRATRSRFSTPATPFGVRSGWTRRSGRMFRRSSDGIRLSRCCNLPSTCRWPCERRPVTAMSSRLSIMSMHG